MKTDQLLVELFACADACDTCYHACLNEEDVTPMAQCILLDRECAEICRLSASFLTRASQNTIKLLTVCADICLQCAEACEKHHHATHCQACAEACRRCYEFCKEFYTDIKQVSS